LSIAPKPQPDRPEITTTDGKQLWHVIPHQKQLFVYPLPDSGPSLLGGGSWLLSLMTGLKSDEVRKRYGFQLTKEDDYYAYLEVVPRLPADRGNFKRARLVLNKDQGTIRQLWYETAAGDEVTWNVTDVDLKPTLQPQDFEVTTPSSDWKVTEIHREKNELPAWLGHRKAPTNPPATATTNRLQDLVKELVRTKKTDEQALEALTLAVLARYPTETERQLLVDYLAHHNDRQEALSKIVRQLLATQEFRSHLENLEQGVPKVGY
jgi:hypothetical protein